MVCDITALFIFLSIERVRMGCACFYNVNQIRGFSMKRFILVLLLALSATACGHHDEGLRVTAVYGCQCDYYGRKSCRVQLSDGSYGDLITYSNGLGCFGR